MATTIQRLMDWRESKPDGYEMDPETVAMIKKYWKGGGSYAAIAAQVDLELEVVRMVIDEGETSTRYIPTLGDIKSECEAIQAEWTKRERRRRQVTKPLRWRVPETHLEIGGDDE